MTYSSTSVVLGKEEEEEEEEEEEDKEKKVEQVNDNEEDEERVLHFPSLRCSLIVCITGEFSKVVRLLFVVLAYTPFSFSPFLLSFPHTIHFILI
jgi:hypothetical protein